MPSFNAIGDTMIELPDQDHADEDQLARLGKQSVLRVSEIMPISYQAVNRQHHVVIQSGVLSVIKWKYSGMWFANL